MNILVDEWLYFEKDGQIETCGRKELRRSSQQKPLVVKAAFLEYQTKTISAQIKDQQAISHIIETTFEGECLINKEYLPTGDLQVIGIHKAKIEAIYDDLKDYEIGSLVPYGLCIRAILKSKELLDQYAKVICLDHLGNHLILSFFEGDRFSLARKITTLDMSYMLSEIKRGWQGFINESSIRGQSNNNDLCVVSNNKEWLMGLIKAEFVSSNHVVHLDEPVLSIKGLSSAKFTMHFALAKQLYEQKKKEILHQRVQTILIALSIVGISIGALLISSFLLNYRQKAENQINEQLQIKERSIAALYKEKFISLLDQEDNFDYKRIYYDFLKAIPINYIIDSFKLEKTSLRSWVFEAIIYPLSDNTIPIDFNKDAFYTDVKVTHIPTHNSLGQLIKGQFKLEEGQL